jgi:hypothetical protein
MDNGTSLRLGELCERLGVDYRHARYILEQGLLPPGVDPRPDRGNHRRLTPAQCFWLAIVLKLKAAAVRAPLAAKIADFAREAVRATGQGLNWDPRFSPFDGSLETEHQWYVDVGDLKYIRLVTDAHPGRDGLHAVNGWFPLGGRSTVGGITPAVAIRVDLAEIARLLRR